MVLDHIGVVVKDLAEAKIYYRDHFGFAARSAAIDEPAQKVKIMFLETGHSGFPTIELIQPVTEDSAVYNFLKKTGGGLHHLSYAVKDLDRTIQHFKNMKSMMIGKIYPGAGHNASRVVWFYTRSKEIVELIEVKKEDV